MAEVFTPDALAKAVPLATDLRNASDGTTLSEDEAVLELLRRFGYAGTVDTLNDWQSYKLSDAQGNQLDDEMVRVPWNYPAMRGFPASPIAGEIPVLHAMMRMIVRALPADMRNAGVLSVMDVRPFLDAMRSKTIDGRAEIGFFPDADIKIVVSPEMVNTYQVLFTDRSRQNLMSAGDGQYETRTAAADQMLTYQQGQAGATPTPGLQPSDPGYVSPSSLGSTEPTIDEEEIRRIFIESGSTDILYLTELLEATGQEGLNPSVVLQDPMLGQLPADAVRMQGPSLTGTPLQGTRLNYRAAAQYLYNGKATPSQVLRLQQKMAAAGLFDSAEGGYVAGDAFDQNTNMAWRNLLGQSWQRQMTIDQTLTQLAAERRAKLPNLGQKVNRMVFDAAARNIIGRGLSDEEENELVAFLTGLREREGLASMGADLQTGYGEQEVSRFIANKYSDEAQGLAEVAGQDAVSEALKRFT